jgi:hypothetical protein
VSEIGYIPTSSGSGAVLAPPLILSFYIPDKTVMPLGTMVYIDGFLYRVTQSDLLCGTMTLSR